MSFAVEVNLNFTVDPVSLDRPFWISMVVVLSDRLVTVTSRTDGGLAHVAEPSSALLPSRSKPQRNEVTSIDFSMPDVVTGPSTPS